MLERLAQVDEELKEAISRYNAVSDALGNRLLNEFETVLD